MCLLLLRNCLVLPAGRYRRGAREAKCTECLLSGSTHTAWRLCATTLVCCIPLQQARGAAEKVVLRDRTHANCVSWVCRPYVALADELLCLVATRVLIVPITKIRLQQPLIRPPYITVLAFFWLGWSEIDHRAQILFGKLRRAAVSAAVADPRPKLWRLPS